MKNKISFTSVLKSKASVSSKIMNGSSQYSMDSQSRHGHQRLMDIYQQYESYPEQDYTLDFSSMSRNFTNSNGRSRNSSMNIMSRSKNGVCNEDPEMSLEMWIERQKKGGNSNYESFNSNNNNNIMGNNTSMTNKNNNNNFMMKQPLQSQQKSFKETLTLQQQQKCNVNNTSNNFNPTSTKNNGIYYQQQSQLQESQCSEDLNNNQYVMDQQKWGKKSPINFKSQQQQQSQQLIMMNSKQLNTQMEDSSNNYNINNTNKSPTPQELLAQEQLKSKTHYPSELEDNDYNRLKEEFEKLKNEKITELCMQAKKSIKKDKLKEIISKALENIYEDIEEMAERMVEEKRRNRENSKNTNIINSTKNMDNMVKRVSQEQQQQEDSESMLISGQYNIEQHHEQQQRIEKESPENENAEEYYQQQSEELQTDREEEERRQEQIRNMIKGYISGIQEAKSQNENRFTNMMGNNNISKQSGENEEEHSFNYNNINNNDHIINNTFNNHESQEHEEIDTVGYSFANNNINNNNSNSLNNMNMMGCEHSFNRDIVGENSGVFYHHYNNNGNNGYNINNDGNVEENNNTYNNKIKPQVYQPEESFSHEEEEEQFNNQQEHYEEQQHIQHIHEQEEQQEPQEQHISIPNIEEVKSDCGEDNYYQQGYENQNNYQEHELENEHEVECSEEIEMQIKNKLYNKNKHLEMLNDMGDNNNIKNIESVHYEPSVEEERKMYNGGGFNNYIGFGNQSNARDSFDNSKKELFRNFEKSHESIVNYIVTGENNTTSNNNKSITSSNNNIHNINKTSFSSMLMRPEINTKREEEIPTKEHPTQITTNTSTEHRFISKTFNSYLSGEMRGEYGQAMETAKESVNMSMNTSLPYINSGNNNVNQESLIIITSPKYQEQKMINNSISQNNHHHQLQSKSNKFSMSLVNSPMTKIDEIMLKEEEEKQKRRSSNSQSPSSYAVSSPLNGGNVGESVNNGQISQFNNNGIGQFNQYACAESIKNDNIKSNNSILDIQPLRLSPIQNDNIINTNISISINKEPHTCNPSTIAKLTESIENNEPYVMTISQQHSIKNNINNTNTITSGRNFLQSLHEKQSIEIELSPSGTEKEENECKESFAAETFRPNVGNSGGFESNKMSKQHVSPKHINTINNINNVNSISGSNNSNSNKLSITKITLRSSDRNNNSNMTSPKVISLMAANNNNNLVEKQEQKTTTGITEFVTPANDTKVDGKENIFQKVTIRASINNSNSSIGNGNNVIDNINNQSHALKESIKFTDNFNNIKNHQTNKSFEQQEQQSSKENNNTMNNSKPALITERKEPLLKLAKNLTNSISQQQQQSLTTSINNTNNLNVKKSIGESIRNKVHQPGMMIMSKNITLTSEFPSISIKQSFNKFGGNVKQSIGNDSDMDFDLELD